jgi:hypothetical protein
MDIVGIVVHVSILVYINTTAFRHLFGRPPANFIQSQL